MELPIKLETIVALRGLLGIVGRASYAGRSKMKQSLADSAVEELRVAMKDKALHGHINCFYEAALKAKCYLQEKAQGPDPKHVEFQREILAVIERIDKEHRAWLADSSIDSNAHFESEKKLMDQLDAFNDRAIDEDIPLGRIHTEGRGDGYAIYVVTGGNDKGELYMSHVNSGDAWTSPMIEQRDGWAHPDTLHLQRHSRDKLFGKS